MTKGKNPKAYIAPHDVYADGLYTKAGESFVTDAPPGKHWQEIDPKAKAAIDASTNKIPEDPPLENLSVEALQAIATERMVNTAGIERNKKALITAIKAANEPAL